jgi:hypothetical protein
MNAFQSSEARWFYRRNRTEIEMIRHWFMNLPNAIVEHQSMRVDYYYRLSQSPRFGIKLRMEGGGKAETKEQTKDYGPVRFHPELEGTVNDWIKWSFALAEPEVQASMLAPSWVAVEKTRWLQRYRIEEDRERTFHISAVRGPEFPGAGFGLEFTEISVEGERWFSVGFEAYDTLGERRRTYLDAGVAYILKQSAPPGFAPADSMSYYAWLAKSITGTMM